MKCLAYYFTDRVSGEAVKIWVDRYLDFYMAVSRYSYRVKLDEAEPERKTIELLLDAIRVEGEEMDQGRNERNTETIKKGTSVSYLYGTEFEPVHAEEKIGTGLRFKFNIHLN